MGSSSKSKEFWIADIDTDIPRTFSKFQIFKNKESDFQNNLQ